MKKLWILPIAIFICAAALVVIHGHCKKNKSLRMNPQSTSDNPQRIISLAPNLTEILFALGLDSEIVAVSNNCDYPDRAKDKPKIGTFWQPNTEAIIASRPDLVITLATEQQKSVAETLSRLRFKVLTLRIEKIEGLFAAIQEIGDAAGCRQRADKLVKNISSQLNNLQSKFSSTDKIRILWAVQVEPLRIVGRNTFINEMIDLVGGENAIGPTIGQYPQISTEEILVCGAEVIIQSAMGENNIDRQQKAAEVFWGKYQNLPAVKDNRIYVVESDAVLRLGPRLPEAVRLIAECLHKDSSVGSTTHDNSG